MAFDIKKLTRQRLAEFIKAHASDALCLEIGCRNRIYRSDFPNSVGIDIASFPNADIQASACSLPFCGEAFDIVLCTEVLEHVDDLHSAISEMHRVLKPSGKLIITVPYIFPLHDMPCDFRRFTAPGLEYMLKGFSSVEVQPAGNEYETIAVLCERLIFQTDHKRIVKLFLYIISRLVFKFHPKEFNRFGGIDKKQKIDCILSWGYHCVCKK